MKEQSLHESKPIRFEELNELVDALRSTVWDEDKANYSTLDNYTDYSVWGMLYHQEINGVHLSWTPWMSLVCALVEVNSDFAQKKQLLNFIKKMIPELPRQAWAPLLEDGEVINFPLHTLLEYLTNLSNEKGSPFLLHQAVDCLELARRELASFGIWDLHSKDVYDGASAQELLDNLIEKKVLKVRGEGKLVLALYPTSYHVHFCESPENHSMPPKFELYFYTNSPT